MIIVKYAQKAKEVILTTKLVKGKKVYKEI